MKRLNSLKLNSLFVFQIFFIAIVFIGCNKTNNDELIFGLKLGQKKSVYHDICYQLNKAKKVTSGGRSYSPETILREYKDSISPRDIKMSFNGVFNDDDLMSSFKMVFNFIGWSHWNKKYFSNILKERIKDTLNIWFPGNDFKEYKIKKNKNIDVDIKLDGNRRISVYTIDNKEVRVVVDDVNNRFK